MSEHPSRYIREELIARRWTRNRLAREMGGNVALNRTMIDFYFFLGPTDPRLRIGDDAAEQIAHAFGTSKELWLNLERAWQSEASQIH